MANEIKAKYTQNDFLLTTKPYEEVYSYIGNPFEMQAQKELMSIEAKKVKVNNFKSLFNEYVKSLNKTSTRIGNATNFQDQKLELNCGSWTADDSGIFTVNNYGFPVTACVHPIMPIERLINVDTGITKVKLAYRLRSVWQTVIVEKRQIASASSIVGLADYGIAVTSENAKGLVQYLHDVETLNMDIIPEYRSVGRLGWMEDGSFAPYIDSPLFDGEEDFKGIFTSVTQSGSYEKWIEVARKAREHSKIARLMLAASFASVLVKPCHALPFFVHVWGGSSAGKTVGLMLAASVWAKPDVGAYTHTFNGTTVGQEVLAGFLNSMPLCLDEFNIQSTSRSKDFDHMVYMLTEGVGRTRGAKQGGLRQNYTWKNTIITTGEQPITSANSSGGVISRIIEIDCDGNHLFPNPKESVKICTLNYGHAGKVFIEMLNKPESLELAKNTQEFYQKELSNNDGVGKQEISASLLLTADFLLSSWIFKDNDPLKPEDITEFLSSKDDVNPNQRALDWLMGFMASNPSKFNDGGSTGELWGEITADKAFIIKSIFDQKITEAGYNSAAFLSWAKREGILDTEGSKRTKKKRIKGSAPVNCVCIKVDDIPDGLIPDDNEQIPF